MSNLSDSDVRKIADMIKIQLTDEEVERIKSQLNTALEPVKVFDELKLDNVKPSSQTIGTKNRLRDDIPQKSLNQKDVIMNAHQSLNGYIVVQRVVKNEH